MGRRGPCLAIRSHGKMRTTLMRDAQCAVSAAWRDFMEVDRVTVNRTRDTSMAGGQNPQDLLQTMSYVGELGSIVTWEWERRLLFPVGLRFRAQLLACTGNSEPLLIEQLSNLKYVADVPPPVHTLSGTALYRFQLRELTFPES
jgi:hypothetical protein